MRNSILTIVVAVLVAAMATSAMAGGPRGGYGGFAGRGSFGFHAAPRYYAPVRHYGHSSVGFSFNFGFGRPIYPTYVVAPPVVYAPAPVVYQPAPIVVQASPPVVMAPTPAPQPMPGSQPTPVEPTPILSEAERSQLVGAFPNGFVVTELDRHSHGKDAGQLDDLRVEEPDGSRHTVEWKNGKIAKIK